MLIHKIQSRYTKLDLNTQNFSNTQNSISEHKNQSQYTKLNLNTQNSFPIHKTHSQYTKLIVNTQNPFPIHKTHFQYTKLILNTQNSFPIHKTHFQYTKLFPDTQNSFPIHKTKVSARLFQTNLYPESSVLNPRQRPPSHGPHGFFGWPKLERVLAMFCSECGFWVRQSYAYCPGCGKQLSNLENSPVSNITTTAPQS